MQYRWKIVQYKRKTKPFAYCIYNRKNENYDANGKFYNIVIGEAFRYENNNF